MEESKLTYENQDQKSEYNEYLISEIGGPSQANAFNSVVIGSRFVVDERYEVLNCVGSGAYGIVAAAKDKIDDDNVAIKKIEKAFDHPVFTKRTLRELKILRLLQHENVIGLKTIQLPKSRADLNDIYVISDLMETDLGSILKSQ